MSWSSSSYPPPRRSRSRSPRSSYPPRQPYPDPAYPGDSYRADWDPYDRDRAWPNYERDRAAYDYGRRGRSRSPPPDEVGRKRRRSLSPYDRDRYDPRPRYNDDYDAHSRSYGGYSPRRGPPPPFPGRRAPPDPHTFDYPATLKQYAEWFRFHYPQQAIDEDNADKAAEQEAGDGSKPRNGIKMRWEKYKKEFAAAQLQTMFDHHRKSPWFAEKYDPVPEFQDLRTRVRKEGWKGRVNAFLHDLESGKFDPDMNESEPEPTSPIKESVSNGEVGSKETNGNAVEDSKADEDIQFNVDGDDEGGDNDASRDAGGKSGIDNKRSNRAEEMSAMPEGNQVMIRTIPPDIGRVKLEEACSKIPGFVYLALGDPLQKRNFYRAGWLRFRDDADMSLVMTELSEKKIEGFKLHVTHNQRPFVNKIRFTPEVASRPDRIAKDLGNAKILAEILEDEAARIRSTKVPLLNAPKVDGEETQGTEQSDVAMIPPDVDDEEPEPLERGSAAMERRIEKVMADLRDQGHIDINDEKAYEEKKTAVSLDLYLAYLRAAYHTCYYCAVVTDHLEELQRKCIKHVRKPLSKSPREEAKAGEMDKDKKDDESNDKGPEKEKEPKKGSTEGKDSKRNDDRWLEWLDSKIALLINRTGVDPRDYGGKSYDEELSKAVEPYIKQEDEGKFRCKTCQKLFKATSFVEKHIANKHPDHVKHLEEIPYFNGFALDPHRIQPFSHPPPPTNSNSQAAPPQAYGIQGPPAYHGEYGRPPYYGGGGAYGPGYPPPYQNGYWDPHAYAGAYGPPGFPPASMVPSRRDEATVARRLSDRISGFAPGTDNSNVPAAAGLPPKPSAAALDSALASGGGSRRKGTGQGGPPPPPPDAKEDPRAAAGKRVSYHDMDLVAEGDVELFY